MSELTIDLGDDLPAVTVSKKEKTATAPIKFAAPPAVAVTSIPVAVVIEVNKVKCLGCGAEHTNHHGIFLQCDTLNGGRKTGTVFQRKSLRELPLYLKLPRRVDFGPMEAIPVCATCWQVPGKLDDAVAVAQVEGGEIFTTDPSEPKPVSDIIDEMPPPKLLPVDIGDEEEVDVNAV